MEDRLKDFIEENRQEFEGPKPSEDLWNRIEGELLIQKRKSVRFSALKIAAVIVLLIGAAGVISVLWQSNSIKEAPIAGIETSGIESGVLGLSSLASNLREVEQYYVSEVNFQKNKLTNYEVDKELLEEVELLKEEFDLLQSEMGATADPTKIVEAMIENYQMRLEILKDILETIKKEENKNNIKNNSHEDMV